MNAKKCDRCGNFFEPERNDFTRIAVLTDGYSYHDRQVTHDVCPACMKEYKTWFAAPETSVEHGKKV